MGSHGIGGAVKRRGESPACRYIVVVPLELSVFEIFLRGSDVEGIADLGLAVAVLAERNAYSLNHIFLAEVNEQPGIAAAPFAVVFLIGFLIAVYSHGDGMLNFISGNETATDFLAGGDVLDTAPVHHNREGG